MKLPSGVVPVSTGWVLPDDLGELGQVASGGILLLTLDPTQRTLECMQRLLRQLGYETWVQPSQDLLLERRTIPFWQLLPLSESAAGGVRALFERVFQKPMSESHWVWKYGGGRGRGILGIRDSAVVAYYGGITRNILYRGSPSLALHVCDVMVDDRERGGLTRQGVFFQVASAFLDLYCGVEQKHRVAYGFPNARVMRLAERLGLYGEVDALVEQRWGSMQGFNSWRYRCIELSGGDLSRPDLHSVWQAMAHDFSDQLLVIRDADYLRSRYIDHPEHRYVLLGLRHRWTGRLQGLVVLRPEPDRCRLLDLIGPVFMFPSLIELARSRLSDWGAKELIGWFTRSQVNRLAATGGVTQETDISIPANIWSVGPPLSELQGRWWLTMGDTDFL